MLLFISNTSAKNLQSLFWVREPNLALRRLETNNPLPCANYFDARYRYGVCRFRRSIGGQAMHLSPTTL
jgi:hypothetical protein